MPLAGVAGPARVDVLGPVRIHTEHALTRAERRLLAALVLAGEAGMSLARLEAAVWQGTPPRTARQSLHNHIHRLRSKLDGLHLVWDGDRYRLEPQPATDAAAFQGAVQSARDLLAADDDAAALELLERATGLWRDLPYLDLDGDDAVVAERMRLQVLKETADDLRIEALLALDRPAAAAGEAERLLAPDPGREARWGLLLRALEADGRRGDALEAYHRARRALIDAHGVEPGPELQRLHLELLDVPVATGQDAGAPPIVGRDGDVAELLTLLREAGRVWLTGEAGIGKTTLLALLADRWTAGRALVLDCGDNPWTALGPVEDLCDRLAVELRSLNLPTTVADMAPPATADTWMLASRPGPMVERTAHALAAALALRDGTLLVLDDVDRIGPTTRAILDAAIAAAPTVTVLAVSRDAEPFPNWPADAPRVELGGLDESAVAELVHLMVGRDLEPDAAPGRWLHAFTAGHPMLVVEMVSELAGTGDVDLLTAAEPRSDAPVPRRLREALGRRLAALEPRARRALDAAAVMGPVLDPVVLRRVIDLAQLEPSVRAGILRRDGTRLRFSHDLLQRVAADSIPKGRRLELHHAIGLTAASPQQRATHLLAAAELDPEAAILAATHAGDEALRAHAHADASSWYGQAATLAADRSGVPDGQGDLRVLGLRLEAADAARLAGQPGHAEPLLELAEALVGADHVELRRRAATAALQLGEAVDPGPAQRRAALLAERALRRETDLDWRARIGATASLLHSMAGAPDVCRRMFLDALAVMPDRDEVAIDVLPYAYMSLGHPDDLALRERCAGQLERAAARTGSAPAAFEAGHLAFSAATMRGDGARMRRAHAAMVALAPEVGDAGRRWQLAYQEASLAAIAGRHDEAEARAGEALQIGGGVAPVRALAAYSGQLLEIRRRQDRLAELTDVIEQLIASQPEVAAWAAAGARAHAATDPGRAGELFDAAAADDFAALPRDFAWLAGMLMLGEAAAVLEDPVRAARVLPHLEPYAALVCWQGTCSYGPVAEVLAPLARLLGRDDEAAHHTTVAGRLRASLGMPAA